MKISDFFSPTKNRISDTPDTARAGKAELSGADRVNSQIRGLTPGSTLQGEVLEKNGGDVKIRLNDDLVLMARLDQEVNVEEGKLLTFEVKGNGNMLSLSPLFANTAASDNVMKALQMANIPVNGTTVAMTETMMQQGMSVDSKSLQAMFKEVVSNPEASAIDIVQLKQLGMPVNEANLAQMENYKALTHQLVNGMTDVLETLPMAYEQVLAEAGTERAVGMFQELLRVFLPELPDPEQTQTLPAQEPGTERTTAGETIQAAGAAERGVQGEADVVNTLHPQEQEAEGEVRIPFRAPAMEPLTRQETEQLGRMLEKVSGGDAPEAQKLVQAIKAGQETPENVLRVLAELDTGKDETVKKAVSDLIKSPEIQKLLRSEVLKQWSLKPEQGMDRERVGEVYERLTRQLEGVKTALENGGAEHSAAMKNVSSLSQNIDFMNQMNHMYTYVQLPLSLSGREANGELYVYTDKRSLAQKDGAVTALLHLDMENLGPVDVYVAMQNAKVNTRFTVGDDGMLDFLEAHMHILTERLEKKGYSMKCDMQVKGDGEEDTSPIDHILQPEHGGATLLAQYGFDVRA